MARPKPWNLNEAAILLEAYIQVAEGTAERRNAIENVSKTLRNLAMNEGIDIDDVYRNVAGITFQMYSMESAYIGRTINKPATKLFQEIVAIRKNDYERYKKLLEEAKRMAAVKDGRAEYQDWLVQSGLTNTAARNYGGWLKKIEAYAQDKNYIFKSVYECEVNELSELYELLSLDEDFISAHRGCMTSLRKYILYKSAGAIKLCRDRNVNVESNPQRYEYQDWLESLGMKNTVARNYGNWLNKFNEYMQEKNYTSVSVYSLDDIEELQGLIDKATSDEEFASNHRDYLTSFRKYIEYKSRGAVQLVRKSNIEKTVKVDKKEKLVSLSKGRQDQYSKILNENFEEGLLLNAIRLDMFRMIFEDEYDDKLTEDDERLEEELKIVGTLVDGRIYPRKDMSGSALLKEIRESVVATLEAGASCVYISSIMERWQQQLADELGVYNVEAIRDIIDTQDMDGIVVANAVFKKLYDNVSPEDDVLSFMKEAHGFVTYADLQEKLWNIPIDTIKRILVTTPSLVQVDWETYMYAPNFPASSMELKHLEKLMQDKISEKGFLVSKDIAGLISEKCSAIAINTEGYKDWAYRNILKYIFADKFEFGGSIVSDKGKKLEMWQVYREFCKDYEHLTFDELKEFSEEVGVQLYWDDILQEMIRINENELVRKDLIHFDINATDKVLNELCVGDYVPIRQINLFLHFPSIEYPWNSFVLESYLPQSNLFKLYHVSYSDNRVFGVIVRKSSKFEDYRQVIVDMLAKNDTWYDKETALALIVNSGYQARKRWSGFEKVMQEALLLRENIVNERK